jgi:hypothetical protein
VVSASEASAASEDETGTPSADLVTWLEAVLLLTQRIAEASFFFSASDTAMSGATQSSRSLLHGLVCMLHTHPCAELRTVRLNAAQALAALARRHCSPLRDEHVVKELVRGRVGVALVEMLRIRHDVVEGDPRDFEHARAALRVLAHMTVDPLFAQSLSPVCNLETVASYCMELPRPYACFESEPWSIGTCARASCVLWHMLRGREPCKTLLAFVNDACGRPYMRPPEARAAAVDVVLRVAERVLQGTDGAHPNPTDSESLPCRWPRHTFCRASR